MTMVWTSCYFWLAPLPPQPNNAVTLLTTSTLSASSKPDVSPSSPLPRFVLSNQVWRLNLCGGGVKLFFSSVMYRSAHLGNLSALDLIVWPKWKVLYFSPWNILDLLLLTGGEKNDSHSYFKTSQVYSEEKCLHTDVRMYIIPKCTHTHIDRVLEQLLQSTRPLHTAVINAIPISTPLNSGSPPLLETVLWWLF